MSTFFVTMSYWHWIGLAAILFIIEMLTGTGFLLWLGISATLTGVVLLVFSSIALTTQLFIFAALAILIALSWKQYLHYYPIRTDRPRLNKRAEQYIDREFTLETSIINGQGTVRVDDTIWQVRCNEKLSTGTSIRIIGAEGAILIAKQSDKE